jgi:hypothetical protein
MVKEVYKSNARHIAADLQWLQELIKRRYESHHAAAEKEIVFRMPQAPELTGKSVYKGIIKDFKFTYAERLVLLLALIPHVSPYFLDESWSKLRITGEKNNKTFTQQGAIPVVDLALFLLGGEDLEKRFFYQQIFAEESFMIRHRILQIEDDKNSSLLLQPLKLSPDYLSLLTQGKPYQPRFSNSFPAKRISTGMEWDELIMNPFIRDQVKEIKSWLRHSKTILLEWELGKRLSPGYKILFYGPPGTGKTLTASLLGKEAGVDVYRVDLSMVVSKFIGETEKNLSRIFDEANDRDWILFFDEADALFGKRTEMKDAHDRYANQEVAFLLQKIEDHNGVVILSSNMKTNIDEAFTRRFQSLIYFPMPPAEERLQIWTNGFSKKSILEKGISLLHIANKYEMSGGAIMNVIRYASLKALEKKKNIIELDDLMNGIIREYAKEGRTI